jgi:hypothetical protein
MEATTLPATRDLRLCRRRPLIEEVKQVVKKARLQTEQDFWLKSKHDVSNKRRTGDAVDRSSDSESEEYLDRRKRRRRIEEKVSTKVSRILGDAGREEQQLALVDNSSRLAALQTAEALEQFILPELEKIAEEREKAQEEEEAGRDASAVAPLLACALQDSLLEKEREIGRLVALLEEERPLRRDFQARAFRAEQDLAQTKLECRRWNERWQESEQDKLMILGLRGTFSSARASSSHFCW